LFAHRLIWDDGYCSEGRVLVERNRGKSEGSDRKFCHLDLERFYYE
jgi:hypothetical protein